MKKLVVAAFAVIAVGCGSLIPTAPGLGTMTMKVDGKDWSAQSGTVVATAPSGLKSITITGSNNGTTEPINSVTIVLDGDAKGTFTLDSKNVIGLANKDNTFKSKSGSVVLTKFDSSGVEGTFETTAGVPDGGTAQVVITSGKFSAAKN